ncbi:MAG TPA: methyltransferase domain-containing protein, partial [Rhodanobacteraceae bacterium]|nr:methyltransferase domain-containing protein [Rhodanobacteraceae bacterium]
PFADSSFDLVCAFDIVEHVHDDDAAFGELARVAAAGATLLLSAPLHPQAWNAFDELVGHCRRYEPDVLTSKLARHGFSIERSAVYGMQPDSSILLDLGTWFLKRHTRTAMAWYNRVFMPLGLRLQKPLQWSEGLVDARDVDEVLLVCRRK